MRLCEGELLTPCSGEVSTKEISPPTSEHPAKSTPESGKPRIVPKHRTARSQHEKAPEAAGPLPLCAHCRATSMLPLCDRCSWDTMNWPVWNTRIDKAYEVARTIAAGTHHNATLHAPTPEVRHLAERRAEEAIASLRAAVARERQDALSLPNGAGTGAAPGSVAAARRAQAQCLSYCYVEARSLFTSLNLIPRRAAGAPAADPPVRAVGGAAGEQQGDSGVESTLPLADAAPGQPGDGEAESGGAGGGGGGGGGGGDGGSGLVREAAVGLALRRIAGGLASAVAGPADAGAGGVGALRLAPVVEAAEAAAQRAVLAQVPWQGRRAGQSGGRWSGLGWRDGGSGCVGGEECGGRVEELQNPDAHSGPAIARVYVATPPSAEMVARRSACVPGWLRRGAGAEPPAPISDSPRRAGRPSCRVPPRLARTRPARSL